MKSTKTYSARARQQRNNSTKEVLTSNKCITQKIINNRKTSVGFYLFTLFISDTPPESNSGGTVRTELVTWRKIKGPGFSDISSKNKLNKMMVLNAEMTMYVHIKREY